MVPGLSGAVAPGLSGAVACGILPDQGLNPWPLHWQADFLPLTLKLCTINCILYTILNFPDSSVGKESAYNAGDPGSISEPGRSTGEGIGYPL